MANAGPFVSPESQDVRKKISLEDMSKEDLIKQVKKQLILLQKTKSKCDELNKHIAEIERRQEQDNSPSRSSLELSLKEKEDLVEKLLLENEELKKQFLQSTEHSSSLQKENNSLQEKYDCINLKVNTLSETCKILQQEGTTLQQQKQELLNEVRVLTEASKSLKDQDDELSVSKRLTEEVQLQLRISEEREQKLRERMNDYVSEVNELNEALHKCSDELNSKLAVTENKCSVMQRQIEQLQSRETEKCDSCEQLHSRLQEVLVELEGAKTKIGELVNENEDLADSNNVLEGRLKIMDSKIVTLTHECNLVESNLKNVGNEYLRDLLEMYQKKCREIGFRLSEENIQTIQELGNNSSGNWISEKENYVKQIDLLTTEKNILEEKMERLQCDFDKSANHWNVEKCDLLKELEDIKSSKEECIEKILQTKTEIETQQLQWKEEKEELVKDVVNVKEWKEDGHQKLEEIQDVRNTLMEQLAEATRTIKHLENDLLKTREQKQDVVEELLQVKDLQKFLEDEVKALREECEKTKIEIKRIEADLENDFLHIQNLEKELCETEEREQVSNKEVEALRDHIACMEEALDSTEKTCLDNCADLEKDVQFYKEKLDQVESEYQNATSRLLELQSESQKFEKSYEDLHTENSSLKDHVSELNSVLLNRTDEMKTEEWEKEKSVLEEQLQEQKDTIEKQSLELIELRETVFVLSGNLEGLVETKTANDSENSNDNSTKAEGSETPTACEGGVMTLVKCEPLSEIEELQKVNENLRTDLQEASEKSVELQEVVETKSQMMEKMLIEMNNLLSQIDDLNDTIREKEQDLESLANKFNNQTDCLKEAEITLSEKDQLINSLTLDHEAKTQKLLEKVEAKEVELMDLMAKNETLMSEFDGLKLQRDNLQEELEKAKCIGAPESHVYEHQEECLRKENVNQEVVSGKEQMNFSGIENLEADSLKTVIVNLKEEVRILQQQLEVKSKVLLTEVEGQKLEMCEELQQKLKLTEEKMAKFKALAMKVKKELTEVKQERDNLVKQNDDLSTSSRQHLLNFQSLQTEYDKLQDEFEAFKDTYTKIKQELDTNTSEVCSLKEQLNGVKVDNLKLQSSFDSACLERKAAEQAKCEAESKVIVLRSEKETEQKKTELVKADCIKLNQRIKILEGEISEEKEQHKLTTQKLEHKLQETKQQNVLNLEIADYEHSISELNRQMGLKDVEISVLQEELSRQAERISNLTEQIGYLESQHDVEEERVKNLRSALTKAKDEVAEIKEQEVKCQNQLVNTNLGLEGMKAAKEELQVQLSDSAVLVSSLQESLRAAKDSHARVTKSFETRLKTLDDELVRCRSELDSTRQEYEGYKVRVHNVLKQRQQPVPVNIAEQEQKQRLEKGMEQLQLKFQHMSDDLRTKNIEMETLQQEHEHLLSRHTRLVSDLQLKDESWMTKMEELRKEHEFHQMMWETQKQKLQQELNILEGNHKKECAEWEAMHKTEINTLCAKLTEKENELIGYQRESNVTSLHSPHDDVPFDILTQERQEGEGSECADPIPQYKPLSVITIPTSGFTPLEQLLQNSSETDNIDGVHQDAESMSESLTSAYKKIEHLTELLNESEASGMRMSEQVRILKEEIRRLERNREREEHFSNLEYLKNIVLKFLLLQGGSERQSLLPVLSTILRLSPEELAQIQATISGGSDSTTSAPGWGNYLHRWSGLM